MEQKIWITPELTSLSTYDTSVDECGSNPGGGKLDGGQDLTCNNYGELSS